MSALLFTEIGVDIVADITENLTIWKLEVSHLVLSLVLECVYFDVGISSDWKL
jgi:hypothetical protein